MIDHFINSIRDAENKKSFSQMNENTIVLDNNTKTHFITVTTHIISHANLLLRVITVVNKYY